MRKGNYGEQNGKDKPVRKPGGVAKVHDAPFRGYVNLNLSDEQKATYEAWSQSGSFWETLEAQIESGVHLSLKLDPKGTGYLGSATQRNPDSPNAGLVVTARGKDAATAWGRTLFCLAVLSRKERWEDTQPIADPDRW